MQILTGALTSIHLQLQLVTSQLLPYDMYSLAVTMWGIAIPLAVAGTYFLNWPVVVVYACTCVDEVGKIPWTLIHFKKYKWVKDLTR